MKKAKKEYKLGSSTLSVSISVELLLELNKYANTSGISRNRLINCAIEELLKKESKVKAETTIDNNFSIYN
jgi:metal-responsive CopG/Arc/MetJ family transcriptional regulator